MQSQNKRINCTTNTVLTMARKVLPIRPKTASTLTQEEQSALTWYVISGCTKTDAYKIFVRPDLVASKTALDKYANMFFSDKRVKTYLKDYEETLNSFLDTKKQVATEETVEVSQQRQEKATANIANYVADMTDKINEVKDPEMILKMADRLGWVKNKEESQVKPAQRFLPVTCNMCQYRIAIEQDAIDECQYCKHRKFALENGDKDYSPQERLELTPQGIND